MTLHEDVTAVCIVLMVIIGIPCLLLTVPAIILGLRGDWSTAYLVIQQGWHLLGLGTGLLICLVLIVGAIDE